MAIESNLELQKKELQRQKEAVRNTLGSVQELVRTIQASMPDGGKDERSEHFLLYQRARAFQRKLDDLVHESL